MPQSNWPTNEQIQELIDSYYKGMNQDKQYIQSRKSLVELIQTKLFNRKELEKLKKEELEEVLIKIFTSTTVRQSKTRVTDNLELIRKNLIYLIESKDNHRTKMDSLIMYEGNHRIKGLGMSFWSIFFMAMDPDNNPYWNNKTENALKALGMNYWIKDDSPGQKYQRIKESQHQLVKLHPEADLYSIDHFMHFITDKKEDGTKLIAEWKSNYGEKHILKWAQLIKQWQDKDIGPERISKRKEGEIEARKILENNLGSFTEEMLRLFCKHLNMDWVRGKPRKDRFSPAFQGGWVNRLVKELKQFNIFTEKLWKSPIPEIENILDEFWKKKPSPIFGAGTILPTTILYLRDPSFYSIHMPAMAQGIKNLTGQDYSQITGPSYMEYNKLLNQVREKFSLQPQEMDIILWFAREKGSSAPPTIKKGYTWQNFLNDTFLKEDFLEKLEKLLSDKRQIVLYGPPGTGKTFVAKKFARYFADQAGGGEVKIVQFHPSYAYEEFIEGIRPRTEDGLLSYEVEAGIFRKLCEEAEKNQHSRYVLILDEINRGNLPRIFGELLYLLEYREVTDSVTLPYSQEQLKIPRNIYIIGTMNTADRSIALVDHALRRRFYFIDLRPSPEILRAWLNKNGITDMEWIIDLLEKLTEQLENDNIDWHLHIGHSHFMVRDGKLDEERVKLIWEHSILPTLGEYFYKQTDRLQNYNYENLKKLVTGASEEI